MQEINRLMCEDESALIYNVAKIARDNVLDMPNALEAGLSIEEYRAKRDAEVEAQKAADAKAKELRAKAKKIGAKLTKNGSELRVDTNSELYAQFKAFMQSKADGKSPLSEFVSSLDIETGETNPAETKESRKARESDAKAAK